MRFRGGAGTPTQTMDRHPAEMQNEFEMPSLASAHRGYEYQDLRVAARLVDIMLDTIARVFVDKKLVPDDMFDDLTTVDKTGRRERTQFKHTDNADQELTLATFAGDVRRVRLDRVVSAALARSLRRRKFTEENVAFSVGLRVRKCPEIRNHAENMLFRATCGRVAPSRYFLRRRLLAETDRATGTSDFPSASYCRTRLRPTAACYRSSPKLIPTPVLFSPE